jgi:hypothetical protein
MSAALRIGIRGDLPAPKAFGARRQPPESAKQVIAEVSDVLGEIRHSGETVGHRRKQQPLGRALDPEEFLAEGDRLALAGRSRGSTAEIDQILSAMKDVPVGLGDVRSLITIEIGRRLGGCCGSDTVSA